MVAALLSVLGGLVLLLGGGEALVRGASDLARRWRISPVIIGLTIVGFGTSAPELAVNLTATLRGDTSIAFGNIVGSNIANIALILGLSAVIRPLVVHQTMVSREIPMMLLAAAALAVMAMDRALGAGEENLIARGEGLVLLLLFLVFLYYTTASALDQRRRPVQTPAQDPASASWSWPVAAAATVLGLGLVVVGGRLTVAGATELAEFFGISQRVIGLTVVAIGTSLPELAASLIAARRGQTDLCVGNIVGSNIFNTLFILGLTASITPTPIPPGGAIDLGVMILASIALLPLAWTGRHIARWEAVLLLVGYCGYIALLAAGGGSSGP